MRTFHLERSSQPVLDIWSYGRAARGSRGRLTPAQVELVGGREPDEIQLRMVESIEQDERIGTSVLKRARHLREGAVIGIELECQRHAGRGPHAAYDRERALFDFACRGIRRERNPVEIELDGTCPGLFEQRGEIRPTCVGRADRRPSGGAGKPVRLTKRRHR